MPNAQDTGDRHVVIDGRRWRATDPAIPAALRAQLVSALMAARRDVATARRAADECAERSARARVHDAKVALGERGEPWWEPTDEGRRRRVAAAMRALLRARAVDSSICPSDAARAAGGAQWRPLVPVAREVADGLAADGVVEATQRGAVVRATAARGPIRIRRGPTFA